MVNGAVEYGEPGVFFAFEESPTELAQNVASLGWDLEALQARGVFALDYVRPEFSEMHETGDWDLDGLLIRLQSAIESVGARRVVLDPIEALFGVFLNEKALRRELRRLFRWLNDRGATALVTAERGSGEFTRHGLEEYVSDCVIALDHRISDQVSPRRLRIVKYRGSAHGSDEILAVPTPGPRGDIRRSIELSASMRRRLSEIETRVLPRGWFDVVRQLSMFAGVYILYQVVRGLISTGNLYKPFGNAMKIINLERTLHVFAEPSIQAWALSKHWLMDATDWAYLYSHYVITLSVLIFIYLRRNDSFNFVRNMFMIAMLIALVGYALFPTAPPALMPEWGFTDAISQFLGVAHVDSSGATSAFVNVYAAVPSMHVCFSVMTGWSMASLVRRKWARIAWRLYPLWITFVVVATGNHYFTDVFLGALTAGISALLAKKLLARARPDVWAFRQATA